MKRSILPLLTLLISLGFSSVIEGYPYQYTELTNGKKNVLLLFDWHENSYNDIHRRSWWNPTDKNHRQFYDSLEELKNNLLQRIKNGKPISLLWEASSESLLNTENTLPKLGKVLFEQCKSIKQAHFTFCDTLRCSDLRVQLLVNLLAQNQKESVENLNLSPELVGLILAPLTEIISNNYQPINDLFIQLRATGNEQAYGFLMKEYEKCQIQIAQWMETLEQIMPLACQEGKFSLESLDQDTIDKLCNEGSEIFIDKLCDLEFILKFFLSQNEDVVIYAGGSHCEKLIMYLMQFGYTLTSLAPEQNFTVKISPHSEKLTENLVCWENPPYIEAQNWHNVSLFKKSESNHLNNNN